MTNIPRAAANQKEPLPNTRIAQAGLRVRAEAKRLLAREAKPQTRPQGRETQRPPDADIALPFSEEEKKRLVEITDLADRPVLCMTPENALKQGLCVRLVSLAPRTRENHIILCRNGDARLGRPGCWGLYTDFVMVGEAREDAGLRILARAGLAGFGMRLLIDATASAERRFHHAIFSVELPTGVYPASWLEPAHDPCRQEGRLPEPVRESDTELLEVDADELAGLTERVPELFTPETLWAAEAGVLFTPRKQLVST